MKLKKIISAAVGATVICSSLPLSVATVNIRTNAVEEVSTTEKSTEISEEQTTEIAGQETSATTEATSSDSENITGQIGDNVYFTLTPDGTLTITGSGEMYFWEDNGFSFTDKYEEKYNTEYEYEYWEPDNSAIKSVTIENGITSIGCVFGNAVNLKSIDIPDSVTRIDYNAFENCSSLTDIKIPTSLTEIGSHAFHGTKWLEN
ncbi:MAG: leucine-rich repeat domain-containing protein, partial [Oscillospiraceae bacterium]|nr:leucine-rich repeat domain-containing protein [Oscillospiraceae bacterium]